MKKFFIYVNKKACRGRFLDAQKIRKYLLLNNYEIVEKPSIADIIFYVTCASVNEAIDESLEKIKEFQKYKAELIVGGCLPIVGKEKIQNVFKGKLIGTKNLEKIDEIFNENSVKITDIDDANCYFKNFNLNNWRDIINKILTENNNLYLKTKIFILNSLFGKKSSEVFDTSQYHLRISWGCTGNCSYCTIKNSTGPYHSKSLNECIREFRRGLDKGFNNFLITAEDTGAYGIDVGSSFPALLDRLTMIKGNYKILIKEVNPKWIIKYYSELEESLKRKKITNIGITVQSGSNRILKLMRRYNDTDKIKQAILRLKNYCPSMSLSTNIIVGFPTETYTDFEKSLIFFKNCDFDSGYIFPFSCREGTDSELLEPKINNNEMKKRLKDAKKFLKKSGYRTKDIKKIPAILAYRK